MASNILSQTELDELLNQVDQLPREELERLAAQEVERRAKEIERRKKYNANLTPEQKEKRYGYQKRNNARKRARQAAIIAKAKELGILKETEE